MDKIIQQIEEDFAPKIVEAQKNFDISQSNLSDIIAVAEEKKKSVREYFEALAKKAEAENIIANSDVPDLIK